MNCCRQAVEMVHGPGCPVCVTPLETIDKAIELASRPDVMLVSYGDMLRVPGSQTDLFHAKAARWRRARRILADRSAENRARESATQSRFLRASALKPPLPPTPWPRGRHDAKASRNFSLLVSHVLVPPAMRAAARLAGQSRAADSSRRGTFAPSWATANMRNW